MKEYYPKLLYPEKKLEEDMFWARDYVRAFLSQGGFSFIYDSENTKIEKKKEIEALNLESLSTMQKMQKEFIKTTGGLLRLQLSLFWFLFITC